MERRTFLGAAAVLALVPAAAEAAPSSKEADAEAIIRMLIQWYRAFGNPRTDRDYYRSFLTDDYLLLENGELLDLAGDMALLESLAPDHVRTDRFDFRYIRVDGDDAYAVYFLESDMNDSKNGPRRRRWLESAFLRRVNGRWRAALLHSTRINPPSS
ncbi:MAG: nuclear transport factor 2 family protein [Sphingomicrobium sp.]